ncbi:MAG: flavin reductase family protein [Candidatus Bathyarchaeia archaeon]
MLKVGAAVLVKVEFPLSSSVVRLLAPKPTVLVTCVNAQGVPNIITVAAVTAASHTPPMFVVAVREDRYSHGLIKETGEFVLNIPTVELIEATDLCGRLSGRNADKFREARLTPEKASRVRPPLIKECPVNIECRVVASIKPGTHTLYVGEALAVHVEEGYYQNDAVALDRFPAVLNNASEYRRPGAVVKSAQ